ncbi:MAG: GNAT family N-acetyltransferase [Chloroflexota bacterium]
MEFANRWFDPNDVKFREVSEVRTAQKSDAVPITRLLHSTHFSHLHVDWRLPVDWLGDPGFVVMPMLPAGDTSQAKMDLVEPREKLLACLAVTADPLPASWVRLTAVSPELDVLTALSEMFAFVKTALRLTAVTEVGWLVLAHWPLPYLSALGFEQATVIETYRKDNLTVPRVKAPPDLLIRPVIETDYERLAELETAVFAPLWRFSVEALRLARREAVSFDVALLNDRLVGYQISSGGRYGAHLVRVCIMPEVQGQGVGTALLAQTIAGYRAMGFTHVTLNTQVDNPTSHHLYEKFGFRMTGEQMPLWVMSL